MLKLRQREDALARGIDLIEWTFDPLEIKNAYFNIERLGAIVRRYVRESIRHHVQPSARRPAHRPLLRRMVARFATRARILDGEPCTHRAVERIAVPGRHRAIRAEDNGARARNPARNASSFESAFESGLAVTGSSGREAEGTYLLGAVAMKIERITLRQIRMPLVHFFETSFGRTYERDIILVEVHERGRFGMGRSHGGRESVLQRGVDRFGVADPARLRAPRVLGRELEERREASRR